MTFEIRDDLPMPGRARPLIHYPFRELKVGQCLVVKWGSKANAGGKLREFLNANPGWKISGRTIERGKTFGFWCVARPDATKAVTTSVRAVEADAQLTPPRAKVPAQELFLDPGESPHHKKLRELAKLQPAGKTRKYAER